MENSQFPKDGIVLGIYTMDVGTGELKLLYSDPNASCYEARPLHARLVPPVIADNTSTRDSNQALRASRPTLLPTASPLTFQAKAWFKGHLPQEREERQRTVQAANWFARP